MTDATYLKEWRLKNPEKFREIQRRYKTKPEVREKARLAMRAKRAADPEYSREIQRAWRARNLEWARKREREWYAKNSRRLAAKDHKRYWADPEKFRRKSRERRQRYMDKVRSSKHKHWRYPAATRPMPSLCECCGRPPITKSIALDHCHKTGIFRGWLCSRCNHAIGLLGDSLEGVSLAVVYLKKAYGDSSESHSSAPVKVMVEHGSP